MSTTQSRSSEEHHDLEAVAPAPPAIPAPAAAPRPTTTAADIGPPPDGGLEAWMQVLASHFIVINTWGYIISYGIFQPYYVETLRLDPSAVSWIGSIQVCLIFLIGTFSGRLFDAGYFRPLLFVGCVMQLVGIFTTSVGTKYWHLLLSQGLCQGLGCGLIFAPTIANTATYFVKKRTIAISLGATGGATGGIIFPLIAQNLLHKVGFGWTVRAMGLVVLILYIAVLILMRSRLPPRKAGPLVDVTAFKDLTYVLFAISMFFTLWATYFIYYYARAYALDRLDGSQDTSFNMLMVINAVGIPGRLVPAYLSDQYFGAVNVFIPTIVCAAVCIFAWAGVHSIGGLYGWIIIIGFFAAGIQSMFPSTLAGLSKDLSKNGTRIGMIFTIISVAALTGPPLAGKLISVGNGSYLPAQIWGGACLCLGAVLLFGARWASLNTQRY